MAGILITSTTIEIQTSLLIEEMIVNDGRTNGRTSRRFRSFNQATNLQQLIDSGEIVNAVQLFTDSQVSLAAANFRYDEQSHTLTIDLTVDGFGGSRMTMLSDGRYQLRFDTSLIWAVNIDSLLVDDDGLDDAIHRFDFHRLLGDFNGNAEVELYDRNLFFAHYGELANDETYDFAVDLDGDGDIDYTDYLIWRSQYRKKV